MFRGRRGVREVHYHRGPHNTSEQKPSWYAGYLEKIFESCNLEILQDRWGLLRAIFHESVYLCLRTYISESNTVARKIATQLSKERTTFCPREDQMLAQNKDRWGEATLMMCEFDGATTSAKVSDMNITLIGKKSFKLREACNVSQAFAKLLKPDSLVDMTAPKRCIQWRCHSRSCVSCHVALRDMLRSRRMNTMYPKKIAKNEKTSSIGLRMAPRVPVRYVTWFNRGPFTAPLQENLSSIRGRTITTWVHVVWVWGNSSGNSSRDQHSNSKPVHGKLTVKYWLCSATALVIVSTTTGRCEVSRYDTFLSEVWTTGKGVCACNGSFHRVSCCANNISKRPELLYFHNTGIQLKTSTV